jgi:hypothetical protein
VHTGNKLPTRAIVVCVLMAVVCVTTAVAQTMPNPAAAQILEPAVWQGPEINAQSPPAASASSAGSVQLAPAGSNRSPAHQFRVALQPAPPVPPQTIQLSPSGELVPAAQRQPAVPPTGPTVSQPTQPLLDGNAPVEELMPPVVEGGCDDGEQASIRPYGGGHPTDWSWGCGGSPYRNGPGMCDNWTVGPRWHITVDGLVMSRDDTDLTALVAQMRANNTFMSGDGTPAGGGTDMPPESENFHYAPGARITFTSQVARCTGYDVQAVYEGVNDWNANVVFPKAALPAVALVIPPDPYTEPGAPFPEGFQQRSLHYRSNLNSGELNFMTNGGQAWRPFFGVRFIRFDDQINDTLNQERQVPLAGPRTETVATGGAPAVQVTVNDPIGPTFETDRLNLFDLENNLMGFQVGLFHDTIQLNERFALEGFVNAGVYYNQVKYSNVMGVFTTQTFADNTRSTGVGDGRTDTSNVINNDARDLSEISYVSEASLTGVCRLNKCWALRGGYQFLWIDNLHLAEAAFLGNPEQSDSLFFHGWHAGIECRR